jgi:tetratricopeptide (TPR) repeat protein
MEISDPLYNEILANGPSPGTLFLVLSRMKENGQMKEVIQECLKALSVYPNDIHIRTLLAESYLEEGQLSQAESELEKVVARIDDLISAYILQAEIFIRQKRTQEAVKALKLYLAHHPDDDSALYLLNELQTTSPDLVSMERPDERKDMPDHDQVPEDSREDRTRKRKLKMIAVLESWLGAVREQSKADPNNSGAFGPWPVDH